MTVFHLIQRQASFMGSALKSIDADYMSCLKLYWQGHVNATVERIGQLLSSQPDHRSRMSFYRLWLQCLWDQEDVQSLKELQRHFQNLSREDAGGDRQFMALQAITAVALDEWELVSCWKAASGSTRQAYWQEFEAIRGMRSGAPAPVESVFSDIADPIHDYCVWHTVTKALFLQGSNRHLAQTLDHVVRIFDLSPLRSLFYSLVNLDSGNFKQAAMEIHEAAQNFSDNIEFKAIQAYALAREGKYKDAIQVIGSMPPAAEDDVDVLAIKAHAFDELDKLPGKEGHYQAEAVTAYRQLISGLRKNNLSAVSADHKLEAFGRAKPNRPESARSWFLSLQLRDYNQLLECREGDDDFYCTVAKDVRRGDICFVGYRSLGHQRSDLKIAAVCLVGTDASLDPVSGYRASLRVIFKPDSVMRIDSVMNESKQEPGARRRKQWAQGDCWNLSEDAFDSIFEPLVAEFEEQFERLCSSLEELNTPVAGYLSGVLSTVRKSS